MTITPETPFYDVLKPWETLDDWQKEYIESDTNCFLLCGRQVGKSTAMSIKAGELAVHKFKKGENILMIALTERQAYQLFFKTLSYIQARYPQMIKKGKDKPTKHEINLTNGVKIMCHPTGLQGEGLRGFTLKKIFADEASRMSDEVFTAVSPMLSVMGGTIDVSSTPAGKQGYFYECSQKDTFKKFYVSAETCPRHKKEFLEAEKESMSELEYAQEYLGVFLDDLRRVFPDELIKKCCIRKRPSFHLVGQKYFLGVDIARMGSDESTFEIIDATNKKKLVQVENIVTTKTLTTQTQNKIIELEKMYKFQQIYIDAGSGSLGVGIFDNLLEETSTRSKVVAINNRERVLDIDGTRKVKLLKEDLYDNLRGLMERGKIELLDDEELILSLKSVQFEYIIKAGHPSQLRIFGNYTHIVEGLIRAAWCSKDKHLNLWCEYS